MSTFERHCEDCVRELGESFDYVHEWLDEFYEEQGPNHRDVRHHEDGVEEARQKWGDKAAEAAIVHIKADCKGSVPTMQQVKLWRLFK